MRTYAGTRPRRSRTSSTAATSRRARPGLSIAFDLPTQTGYDPTTSSSAGEVGKVGVSIAHKGDMHTLLDGIPLDEMNTSMTINATAAWLLALYMTVARRTASSATPPGHHPERHHQGVPLARDLRVPARARRCG
jgi:(2R)-ethylmalonyl-CoA mutase